MGPKNLRINKKLIFDLPGRVVSILAEMQEGMLVAAEALAFKD